MKVSYKMSVDILQFLGLYRAMVMNPFYSFLLLLLCFTVQTFISKNYCSLTMDSDTVKNVEHIVDVCQNNLEIHYFNTNSKLLFVLPANTYLFMVQARGIMLRENVKTIGHMIRLYTNKNTTLNGTGKNISYLIFKRPFFKKKKANH